VRFLCKDCWIAHDEASLLACCKVCDVNSGIHRLDPATEIAATARGADGHAELVCVTHRSEPLDLFCGECRKPLSPHALLGQRSVVAVLGGVGSGKTSLLWVLRERLRVSNGLRVKIRQPLGDTDQQLDQAVADALISGRARRTAETDAVVRNYAWELVTTSWPRQSTVIAFHDAAGEMWRDLSQLPRDSNPRFYRYLDLVGGVIFLIDGEQLAEALASGERRRQAPGDAEAQEIAILDALERRITARGGEMPVAVTISKADVLWNDERWKAFAPNSGATREEIEEAARTLLKAAGRAEMLEAFGSIFSSAAYFAVSAFGRTVAAGTPLTPEEIEPARVEEPLLSLIDGS
jgi:hypothetical protein